MRATLANISLSHQANNSPLTALANNFLVSVMEAERFERAFVAKLVEIIEGRGMKHDHFAQSMYPNKKTAGTLWRRMRNGDKKGVPKLSLAQAFIASESLGKDFWSLAYEVQRELKPDE